MSKSAVPGPKLARALFWWMLADTSLGALWLAGAVFTFSDASASILLVLLLIVSGTALAGLWSLRTAIVIWRRLARRRIRFSYGARLLWILMPLFGLAGIACAKTDWDLRLRLKLSEDALLAEAQAARNAKAADTTGTEYFGDPGWVGLFRVHSIWVLDDATVRFVTVYPGVVGFEESGLHHSIVTDPAPSDDGGPTELRDLGGPWRAFYQND